MSTATDRHAATSRAGVTAVLLAGAGVAVALGVYAKVHSPAGRPLFTLGFSGMLQMGCPANFGHVISGLFYAAERMS